MSKQVRLRRGTTEQHASFTGADGELTFDTTRKVLVVHDGVTPGGRAMDGFVRLDPGNSQGVQEVKSRLQVTGGDEDTAGLSVAHAAVFNALVANGGAEVKRLTVLQETLVYGSTVNLDFRGFGAKRLELAGNVTLTTSNLGFGAELLVRLKADGSTRTLAFPAGWKFVGAPAPVSLGANKTALLRLWCFGMTDAEVVALWLVES